VSFPSWLNGPAPNDAGRIGIDTPKTFGELFLRCGGHPKSPADCGLANQSVLGDFDSVELPSESYRNRMNISMP